MALGWGYTTLQAASSLTAYGVCGLIGSVLFGWLADRLAGALALSAKAATQVVFWLLLLLHPPYAAGLVTACGMGVTAGGMVSVLCATLLKRFGAAAFSRAYDLYCLLFFPLLWA